MRRNTWRIYGDSSYVTGRRFGQRLPFARSAVDVLIQGIMAYKPMAYWPLNDPVGTLTARDVTGNGFTGTVSGSVTFGSTGLTSFGETAASFSGGHIITPAVMPPVYTLIASSNISSSAYGSIIQNAETSPKLGYYPAANVSYPGEITFQNISYAANSGTNNLSAICNPVATFDGENVILYQNGTHSTVQSGNPSTSPMTIGNSLTGTIAHVAIFNRALTPEEIAGIYALVTATPSTVSNCSMDASIGPLNNSNRGAVMGYEDTRALLNQYYWIQENIPPGGTQVSGSGGLLVNQNILLSQGSGQYGIMLIPPHSATIKTNGGFPPPQNSLLFLRFT